jgi:hypothetical protein|tara:strand:+ start:191 stop:598 length:408 start_codon:yes stop_codon:yes gene_type:complete
MITRNESMMASLLCAAIDDGFRLAVKDGKLYMIDMVEPDLGGYPLCFPIKFTGNGFADLDVVRVPNDATEPPFRTMYEVVHGEPTKFGLIKGTPISTKHEDEPKHQLSMEDEPPISTKLAEDTNFWPPLSPIKKD